MKLRTVVTAGLVASALTMTAFAAFSAHAQNTPASVQIAQANTNDPAARLQDAILALKDAQKELRAAKKTGKGVVAAQKQVRQARKEVKAARQAVLAAGKPAGKPAARAKTAAPRRPVPPARATAQQPPVPPAGTAAKQQPAAPAKTAAPRRPAPPARATAQQRPVPPARATAQQPPVPPAKTAAEQPPVGKAKTFARQPAPVATGDPQARLDAATLAVKNAQRAYRAARKSGKGVNAARARLQQANNEFKAAQQAVLAAGQPTESPDRRRRQQTETAAEQPPTADSGRASGRQTRIATNNPQARLDAATLAVNDAQKAFRAAKKSGKGVKAARIRLRAAREELNAAKQAVAELAQQKVPAARKQTAPAVKRTEAAKAAEPEVKTGIAGETVDPQVQRLRRKLRQARQRAQQAEQSAAAAQARTAGGEVVRSESDRVIIKLGDKVIIRSQDENERFLRRARDVDVVQLSGGRTRTTVTRRDGVQIITVTNRYGEIIRRLRRLPNGQEIVLIDNRQDNRPAVNFDIRLPRLVVPIPRRDYIVDLQRASEADIHAALTAPPVERIERIYSLEEVRRSERLRDKIRRIDLDTVTFASGSAAISRSQVRALTLIGEALEDVFFDNPDEIYLVEGHTDAVGSALYNLTLSDRRAESVAIILSESFDIPPENLITQGYGEDYLKIPTLNDERRNRRVTIRRITPLIRADAQ